VEHFGKKWRIEPVGKAVDQFKLFGSGGGRARPLRRLTTIIAPNAVSPQNQAAAVHCAAEMQALEETLCTRMCHLPVRHAAPHSGPNAEPTTVQTASGGRNVFYANCAPARSAGSAPVLRGQTGYSKHLDRDGHGIGCE